MIHLAKSISMKAEDKAQSLQEDNYATGSEDSGDMPSFLNTTSLESTPLGWRGRSGEGGPRWQAS